MSFLKDEIIIALFHKESSQFALRDFPANNVVEQAFVQSVPVCLSTHSELGASSGGLQQAPPLHRQIGKGLSRGKTPQEITTVVPGLN